MKYSMRLCDVLRNVIPGGDQWQQEVFGLALDSREVQRGDLFFAYRGAEYDGRDYIEQAIRRGAVAVLADTEENQPVDMKWHKLGNELEAPVFYVPHLRHQCGLIADRFYGHPSAQMSVIGITGTNGKTSCAHFIANVLQQLNHSCGLIGTLGYGFPGQLINAKKMTTLDPVTLHQELAYFSDRGAETVVMEVSSHGLHQGRLQGVAFDVGVFTNLSRDHLDYHGDMDRYAQAKRQLFDSPTMQSAVINIDDGFGHELAESLSADLDVYAYSIQEGANSPVKLIHATSITPEQNDIGFTVHVTTPWGEGSFHTPLLGRFNISNLLAVIGVLGQRGIPLDLILAHLSKVEGVPGRMEAYGGKAYPLVVVDYAHTPDALEQSLNALREHCKRKLWCVFGCGGDRDRGKRALMGKVAERYSDQLVITDDNPRREDPQQIIADITSELLCPWAVEVERDRYTAIAYAIHNAQPEDVVLVAGKGHEDCQIVGDRRLVFKDAEQVQLLLSIEKKHIEYCVINELSERMKFSDIAHWLGSVAPTNDLEIPSISIDSRTISSGALFIALRGEHYDGHDFIADAERGGAAALIVEHDVETALPYIKINNTRHALGSIAKHYAQQFDIPFIGVTGSNGKTTTKNMIGHILSQRGETLVTAGNFNNDIGVPLTLLRLNDQHQFAVIECGTNHPGEMAYLASILNLDVAVITNAGPCHLEFLGTVEDVAKEKKALYHALHAQGTAVINIDDDYASLWQADNKQRPTLTFGFNASADVRATDVIMQYDGSMQFTLCAPTGQIEIQLSLLGKHNVQNALAAATAAQALGASLEDIKKGLEAVQPEKHRLQSYTGYAGVRILDDCYNASPESVRVALEVLSQCEGEKVLVLGDLLELGADAETVHRDIGETARAAGVSRLFAYGVLTPCSVAAFGEDAWHFDTHAALSEALRDVLTSKTTVLVKGSRGARMEKVINNITEGIG